MFCALVKTTSSWPAVSILTAKRLSFGVPVSMMVIRSVLPVVTEDPRAAQVVDHGLERSADDVVAPLNGPLTEACAVGSDADHHVAVEC
jgi:hypothetical protein